jgi:hypothetical protein
MQPKHKFILFSFMFVLMAMAVALLLQNVGVSFFFPTRAALEHPQADLSVVGQPSLPAATVDAIFKSLGSPMAGTGQVVVQASRQTNIDDAFALGVWWTETNDGAAGVGLADRNPGSVRGSVGYPSAFDGYTIYPSYSAAIVYWFNLIRNGYVVDRGLSTVYAISHPYVGTSSSYLWAGKVVALMLRYRGEAPPPSSPTPTPVPRPTLPDRIEVIDSAVHANPGKLSFADQVSEPSKQSSSVTRQASTPPALLAAIEYLMVFFALLLVLTIAVRVLRLEKKGTRLPNTDALRIKAYYASGPNTDALGMPAFNAAITNIAPFLHLPSMPASQEMPAAPAYGLVSPATGTNFPIRRQILVPSVPLPVPETPGTAGSRPTGLLRRYGEMPQR